MLSDFVSSTNNLEFSLPINEANFPTLDEQISTWKSVFQLLMNHELYTSGKYVPERIPLSELPSFIIKEYFIKLKQFYIFTKSCLQTEEQNYLWREFLEEDLSIYNRHAMTHESFIFSTFRLSILMDIESILKNTIVEPELKELIRSGNWRKLSFYHETFADRVFRFPNPPMSLIAPIFLQEGEVPIHNFIEAFLLEDFPYGLAAIPLDPTYVHGGTMAAPGLFYSHDLLHWPVFVRLVTKFPDRWKRLRAALKELYLRNTKQDAILNYFIFMILHEGALADHYGQEANDNAVEDDILFLIEQIYSEMENRFDYHRSFLKNFFLVKLQDIISKPFKLYAVDEIDEQRLDVLRYKRISPNCYSVTAVLMSHNEKAMEVDCTVIVTNIEAIFFSACSIKDISVSYISSELRDQEALIIEKFLGETIVKNTRYFFYIDIKDHLKVFNKLTNSQLEEDSYNKFLPWVHNEIKRLTREYASGTSLVSS